MDMGASVIARMKKLNETKMILRQPLLLVAVILTILLLLLFVVYPLLKILIFSMTDADGNFSLENLKTILTTSPIKGIEKNGITSKEKKYVKYIMANFYNFIIFICNNNIHTRICYR